ncbi:uncharacterized protein LOC135195782 [Macrobrachium nipponense]|uniref:uncharacterized protein LOC135195782 n=1 Tax=Macrobrachium nipponense TaxID=159736 RepID=UPI0030C8D00B
MAKCLFIVVLAFLHCECSSLIRKNNEPYMYKSINTGRPILFVTELVKTRPLKQKDTMMMMGNAPEDFSVDISKRPIDVSSRTNALLNPAPINEVENTIEEMVDVMNKSEEVGSDDPLMNDLMEIKKEMNNTKEVTVRTGTPSAAAETPDRFMDRVKELLAASGIEAQLPLDCGRNPLSPGDPLNQEPLPWVVALGSREDGRFHYRCTGAVIDPFHVLTDAECVTSPNINVAHMNVTGVVPEPYAIENFVVGRRVHPSITDADSLLNGDNIGILELALPLEFNDYIQPICLPGLFDKPDPDEITNSTILGFDNIRDTRQGRVAGLYAWPNSKTFGAAACYSAIRSFNMRHPDETSNLFKIITKNHLCVDRPFEEVGKSIVVREDPKTGRVQLLGVGPIANAKKTNPIAYTLVQPHRFWIELVLKKFKDNVTRLS